MERFHKIAKITKRDVIIYSRLGMGNSSPLKEAQKRILYA